MLRSIQKLGTAILIGCCIGYASSIINALNVKAQDTEPPRIPLCEGGLPTGQVKCTFEDPKGSKPSDYYEGGFVNGKPEGRGVYVYTAEGNRYEGEFRNGLPNGQGRYLFQDDSRWEGQFRDGFIVFGAAVKPNGDLYLGGFVVVFNLKTKKSTSQPKDKDGQLIFVNGDRFRGEFFSGKPFGQGVFTRPDGTRCAGQFFNDNLDARGLCTYPNGTRYEGEFRKAIPHGLGTLIDSKGRRFAGVFRNGKLQ